MPELTPDQLLDALDLKQTKTSPATTAPTADEQLLSAEARALSALLRAMRTDIAELQGNPAESVTITAVTPS